MAEIKQIPIGTRFTRLVVTGPMQKREGNHPWAPVRCDCGSELWVTGTHLRTGHAQSCGCLWRERFIGSQRTHGKRRSPSYKAWAEMRQRCLNPTNERYAAYGGRGIKICERWWSFANFFADMGERPSGMTLERIDNDGDYRPDNCRWATWDDQRRNKRTTVRVVLNGKQMCMAEALRFIGLPYHYYRNAQRKGLDPQQIIDSLLLEAR